ncbi:MAG: N-acetylglucosamine-6-phosphate deacetylase [Lachnospiraceae bacterium]|nr:N-acetylglucosamine-6-phosphate deacetylase [Lachnospiraceae bacterium]
MKITNAKLFLNRTFVPGGIEFERSITALGQEVNGPGDLDAEGCFLIPGLIDIHTHGAAGADTSDGDPEGLVRMSRYYAAGGVTSWCPTTVTLPEAALERAVTAVRSFSRPADGAKISGIHLEGPFLSYEKRGAQNAAYLHAPDTAMFRRLQKKSGGLIKLITIAPELPRAMAFIREISKECTVSLGHTACDYETAVQAFDAGAAHVTHLFNAMNGLHHRAGGLIAAAADCGATVELITDGFHVHPPMIRMAERMFGEKLVLISDSLRCAGEPDGAYELGGKPVTLRDGKAVLNGTETLAGSTIHLMEGLRRAVSYGMPLEAAVYAATEAPAKAIRMENEIGVLSPGRKADFVLLDEKLNVKAVYIEGKRAGA